MSNISLTPDKLARLQELGFTDPQKLSALQIIANSVPMHLLHNPSLTEFASSQFYIPPQEPGEKPHPILLKPWQPLILNFLIDSSSLHNTSIFSTRKKSGKTALAGLIGRYKTQYSGSHAEVYCLANDKEQAEGRIYQAALNSIELDPDYNYSRRTLRDEWRIIQKEATYHQHSTMRAVALDYQGEAGSNPDITLWSEVWGLKSTAAKRMWTELTPVPTKKSMRYVETYAGYEGESDILQDIWNLAVKPELGGRRITKDELLGASWLSYFPNDDPDQIPFFENIDAGVRAYIDQGPQSRRLEWQTDLYYAQQARTLSPDDFERLHYNYWSSSISEFIPIEWWHACKDLSVPPLRKNEPVVLGADASVTGDCTALVGVSRHPHDPTHVVVRFVQVWRPSKGQPLDYGQTIEPAIRQAHEQYNVVEVAYDPYQLHYLTTNLKRDGIWCKPFSQMGARMEADKQLFDVIRDRRIHQDGNITLEEHIKNCAAKKAPGEDTKLRLIKKGEKLNIDGAVALSMAVKEALWLNLV